jgi:hypothetical protein
MFWRQRRGRSRLGDRWTGGHWHTAAPDTASGAAHVPPEPPSPAAGRPGCHGACRGRPDRVSVAPDQVHRALSAGRRHRPGRPVAGGPPAGELGPERGGGEQGRCQRHDRQRDGGPCSAPDGHTVLVGITTHIQNSAIFAKVPYDPIKDFEPVSQICLSYLVLVVKPDFPANNLKEFVALVKANPGKYSFGSFGTGSSSHIVGETLRAQGRARPGARALQGVGADDERPARRPGALRLGRREHGHPAHRRRQAQAAGGDRRAPRAAAGQRAHAAGKRLAGLRAAGLGGLFVPAGTPKPIVDEVSRRRWCASSSCPRCVPVCTSRR